MKKRNARKMYMDYIKEMNNEEVTRELLAYQDYGSCFAIMKLTTRDLTTGREWTSFSIMRIDFYCNIEPIRTFSEFNEALTALSALSYKSKPIITLPF